MHPGIKLRHLRLMLDVAAGGSVTATARAQGITQPAVSRSLAELETLLGVALFRRDGRRLRLTPDGARFRTEAAAALAALDAAADRVRPGAAAATRLALGVLPSVAGTLMPRLTAELAALRPGLRIVIETGPNRHLLSELRAGRIELMVGRMPSADEMTGLRFDHLYDEAVALVLRPDHPLRNAPVREMLAACPVILPAASAIIRPNVDAYLAALGVTPVAFLCETVALATGRGLVLGSDAVWFISRGVVAWELARGLLAEVETGAPWLSGAVGITRRQGEEVPAVALAGEILRTLALSGTPT
ncbi:MAG: LysR substrate-binding domain-containing protein [Gemmobacter sp.]